MSENQPDVAARQASFASGGEPYAKEFTAAVVVDGARGYIPLPFDPNEEWGAKEKHYVTGAIGEYGARSVLEERACGYVIPLGPAWLRDRRLENGKTVNVTLMPEGPQVGTLPPDIASALNSDPEARAFFESLATFYRRNFIRDIENARRPETRQKRIAVMMEMLKAKQRQR